MEVLKVIESSFAVMTDFDLQFEIYNENENLAKKLAKTLDNNFCVVENDSYNITFKSKYEGVGVVSFDLLNSLVKVDIVSLSRAKESFQMELKAENIKHISAWLKLKTE